MDKIKTAKAVSFQAVNLTWLGQAGFLIESPGVRIIIDPYLSDSLAVKYKDGRFPHIRMVPVPVRPEELTGIDIVLCTHGHSDHMDPGTLPVLAAANPECRFIGPASETLKAVERGVPAKMYCGLDAAESLVKGRSRITAIASAHEDLAVDDEDRSLYLGYVIEIGGYKIYHSGDSVPYEGLVAILKMHEIDAALLPVNGRDELRSSNGIAGNFTVEEAVQLCCDAGIPKMIPHHFGMFDFNTEDPDEIDQLLSKSGLDYMIPVIGRPFILN